MKTSRFITSGAAWLLLGLGTVARAEPTKLVQLSDVHTGGPYFSPSAFHEGWTQGLKLHPDGLLLTGDHGDNSHDVPTFYPRLREGLKIWNEPLRKYRALWPKAEPVPIFFATGNDDHAHNYQSQPADLAATAAAFREAFGDLYYLDEQGNGVAPSRLGGRRWVTLNAQMFSVLNHGQEAPQQAEEALQWLRTTLAQERGPVTLLSHIPPAGDLFSREPAWQPRYLQALIEILDDYPGEVVILCGHFHRNHVQFLATRKPTPVLTEGALATKFGYASNWRDYRWEGQHIDYTLHFTGHPEWTADFQVVRNHPERFLNRLRSDPGFYAYYLRNLYGYHKGWREAMHDAKLRLDLLDSFFVTPEKEERRLHPAHH